MKKMYNRRVFVPEFRLCTISHQLSENDAHLAEALLQVAGCILIRDAVPKKLLLDVQKKFTELLDDCIVSNATKSNIWPAKSEITSTIFWERNQRYRIFPKLKGPFSDPELYYPRWLENLFVRLLGPKFYCKAVSSDVCMSNSQTQAPHRDIEFYRTRKPVGYICNIALTECNDKNGPLEIWPGSSHFWDESIFMNFGAEPNIQDGENPRIEQLLKYQPSVRVEMRPGDILIRDPGTLHRGTCSESINHRQMLTLSYYRHRYFYKYLDGSWNFDREVLANLDARSKEIFRHAFSPRDYLFIRQKIEYINVYFKNKKIIGLPFRTADLLRWKLRERRRHRVKHHSN